MSSQSDTSDCECFYTAAAAVGVVCGVYLIVAGKWWGWIITPICLIGLVLAAVAK